MISSQCETFQSQTFLYKKIEIHVHTLIDYLLYFFQDGVVSPSDCDLIMSQGLGVRYAFMGPWETGYLNAEGNL